MVPHPQTQVDTFEVTGMTYTGPAELIYTPSMSKMIDGITKLHPGAISKTVDNFMVKPLNDGGFELYLTHTLKEGNDIVLEAEIVATWHFNSLEHLQNLSDKIATSVKKQS